MPRRVFACLGTLATVGALALAVAVCVSSAEASPTLPLDHARRWITDADGRVVIVHGTNMVYKRPPYYPSAAGFGEEDAAFLQSIGFNAVRLGVMWQALEPEPGVFDETYVAHIKETIEMLASHGILSQVEMHEGMYNEQFEGVGFPNWAVEDEGKENTHDGFPYNYEFNPALNAAFDNFWANSPGPEGVGLQDYFTGAWHYLAAHLAGTSGIMGYEIMNEPWPGTEWTTCAALAEGKTSEPCPTFDARLDAMYDLVAPAIREADPTTPIYYEPNLLFDFGAPTATESPPVPNAGFAFHDYCLQENPNGCRSEAVNIANALKHVRKTQDALLLTEFGSSNHEGDLSGVVAKADAKMVPWLEWAFCYCEDPLTTGGETEGLVKNLHEPPTGENIRPEIFDALVEPYPQLISGTPISSHFDRETKMFTFTYSPRRAGGGKDFGEGATTEVAVPKAIYPNGYAVSATGADVTSAPGSSTLILSQQGKPKRISVTVSPE